MLGEVGQGNISWRWPQGPCWTNKPGICFDTLSHSSRSCQHCSEVQQQYLLRKNIPSSENIGIREVFLDLFTCFRSWTIDLRQQTWRYDLRPLPPSSPSILVVHFCSFLVHFSGLPTSNMTYSERVPVAVQLQSGKRCNLPVCRVFQVWQNCSRATN